MPKKRIWTHPVPRTPLLFVALVSCAPSGPVRPPPTPKHGAPNAKHVEVLTNPASNGVECGAGRCVAGEVCCGNKQKCLRADGVCAEENGEEYTARCDGPEDCVVGAVCCSRFFGKVMAASCARADDCKDDRSMPVCHSGADCPPGSSCTEELPYAGKSRGCYAR